MGQKLRSRSVLRRRQRGRPIGSIVTGALSTSRGRLRRLLWRRPNPHMESMTIDKWANPFAIKQEADREAAIDAYERWLRLQPQVIQAIGRNRKPNQPSR